jgi:hypothetical protein
MENATTATFTNDMHLLQKLIGRIANGVNSVLKTQSETDDNLLADVENIFSFIDQINVRMDQLEARMTSLEK